MDQLLNTKIKKVREGHSRYKHSSSSLPKKICYVASDVPIPSPRGSSVHVTELAKSLCSLGHEVHVICRRTRRDEPQFENLNGFTVHRIYRLVLWPGSQVMGSAGRSASETRHGVVAWLYSSYLRTFFSLYVSFVAVGVIRKNKLGAIIERETSFGAGGLASFLSGKPMILEIVGPRYSRISVWRSKEILYYAESMLRNWVKREKCLKVSGGVNLSLFHEDEELRNSFRAQLGFGLQNKVIGYIGTFQDWHGIDTLLYSLKELRAINPNVKVLLAGPYYEKYESLAKSLGLGDICLFTGPVEHEKVSGYINASDIMVALYEPGKNRLRRQYGIGSPLKILEYMACGKPVISTDVKPIDEVVHNGESGYLVEPGNQKALISAISSLLNDSSEANSLGIRARKMAEMHHSWKELANTVDSILSRA